MKHVEGEELLHRSTVLLLQHRQLRHGQFQLGRVLRAHAFRHPTKSEEPETILTWFGSVDV